MPSSPPSATSTVDELGLTLAAITPELRERFQLGDDIGGVIVVDVDPAGVAAEKGIQPGDIIVEVAQEEVTSPDEVAAKIKEQSAQDKSSILLLVSRQGDLQFVAVRLKA
jgi:serine protease Do